MFFSHFSLNHTKTLLDEQWEWDLYEQKLLACIDKYSKDYEAVFKEYGKTPRRLEVMGPSPNQALPEPPSLSLPEA